MKYSDKDKTINDQFYGYFLRHNQDDGWGDNDKYGNFKLLTDIIDYTHKPLKNTSVLDVGCGTGDLYNFLRQRGVKRYLGIDIYHMSVEYAHMKYPQGKFITSDFLEYEFKESFDYIFCSGALAAILETNNYYLMTAFIHKMWSLTTVGLSFNFLTREYEKEKDDELFLYDRDEVLKLCKESAPSATLKYVQNRAGDDHDFLQTHIYLIK